MKRRQLTVPAPSALQELVDAVLALSSDPTPANVERYLASSLALEASRVPVAEPRKVDGRRALIEREAT